MKLKLKSNGLFEGQFVLEDEYVCFSIGDYIEVTLLENPYPFDELALPGRTIPIIRFPLRIEFSASSEKTCADFEIAMERVCKHWYECLEVGKTSVVIPYKMSCFKYQWYVPKIDGYVAGMYGKVKTP